MKRSNVVVYALLLACSIALMCIWYLFGFDAYDPTPYYLISILWWIVIVVCAAILVRSELSRRAAMRTVYVSQTRLFNIEFGLVNLQGSSNYAASIAGMLSRIRYGFESKSIPNIREMGFRYVVHTRKFFDGGAVWIGDVKDLSSRQTRSFSSREQLAEMLRF